MPGLEEQPNSTSAPYGPLSTPWVGSNPQESKAMTQNFKSSKYNIKKNTKD